MWEAWDPDLERDVAIKFIVAEEGEERKRFEREARTAAALSHPNIVRVHDVGDGYIVMDLVRGVRADRAGLSARDAARAMRDVALALQHAHGRGIIHRDLKPENILVADGIAFVTDFGLARRYREASTISISGEILGTPAYMSPEQARGDLHALGPATDVYGIGATLYAVLSGEPPFRGENVYQVVHDVLTREPSPPPGDADLQTIVLSCLEKDPLRRYPDARALADDLDRYVRGDPVLARRAGWASRLARRLVRNKAVVGLAAALLLAVAAGSAFTAVQASAALERAQLRTAELSAQEAQQSRAALVQRALLTLMQADETMAHPDVDAPALHAELDALAGELEAVLSRTPGDARMHFALGGCRRLLGETERADAAFAEAIRCDAGFAEAHLERARISIEAYVAAARIDHGDRALLVRADAALREAAQLGVGRPQLERKLECYALYARQNAPGLRKACADALRSGGRVEDFAFLNATLDLMADDATQVASAEKRLGEALRLHPNHAGALKARIVARFRLRRLGDAIEDASRAVELYPRDADAWRMRAIVRRFNRDPKGALADAERSAELDPGSSWTLSERAAAKEDLGDDPGAEQDYGLAIGIAPEDPILHYNRALVRVRRNDPEGALSDLDRSIGLRPAYANAWINRGALRIQFRQFEGAIDDLTRAVRLAPDRFEAYLNRGNAYVALERYAEAEADYGRVLELAPADWPAREEMRQVRRNLRKRLGMEF